MKIYYAIEEEVDLLENFTEEQVDAYLTLKANGKDFVWSFKQDLFSQTY